MAGKENKSSFIPTSYKGKHLKLSDLKEKARDTHMYKKYLTKDIPLYPGPNDCSPEFRVSNLKHDTHRFGLQGINTDNGFKDPHNGLNDVDKLSLVWFSLAVEEEEIESAERTLLQKTNMTARQPGFLKKFASSPAFKKKSRYGSYRFTFTVEEVLNAYRTQFCEDMPPVMRVFRTTLYQKEVMYAVLVHRPTEEDKNLFKDYTSLSDVNQDAVCTYEQGQFIWRPQAMCDTHKYKLTKTRNEMDAEKIKSDQWYVWDHVTLALHVKKGEVLRFDPNFLLKNLTSCEQDEVTVAPKCFDSRTNARKFVRELWNNPNFEQDGLLREFEDLSLRDHPV
ncbi:uncharacterized protein LOC102796443 [Neolamprologus brichardi]|uniref:uncharacterized protein LOC102796443 n=1 Tax=Neolamprologus brichardi TaxID=32507 RepID=UPI0003EC111F|nr:uncharacterized protein LOC102796443 [Neolamprologus brichardi]